MPIVVTPFGITRVRRPELFASEVQPISRKLGGKVMLVRPVKLLSESRSRCDTLLGLVKVKLVMRPRWAEVRPLPLLNALWAILVTGFPLMVDGIATEKFPDAGMDAILTPVIVIVVPSSDHVKLPATPVAACILELLFASGRVQAAKITTQINAAVFSSILPVFFTETRRYYLAILQNYSPKYFFRVCSSVAKSARVIPIVSSCESCIGEGTLFCNPFIFIVKDLSCDFIPLISDAISSICVLEPPLPMGKNFCINNLCKTSISRISPFSI